MTDVLVRIVAPHFVAGVVIDADTALVIEAAPILWYAHGWGARRLRRYTDARGWSAARVAPHSAMTAHAVTCPTRSRDRVEGSAVMSQQWPDPNDPNTPHPQPIQTPPGETPAAPHTPESPRETPEPSDDA